MHSEKKNDMGKVEKEPRGTLNKDGVKRSNELNFMNDRLKKLERKNEELEQKTEPLKFQVSVERRCRKMIRNDVMMAFEEINQLKESIKMMKDSK